MKLGGAAAAAYTGAGSFTWSSATTFSLDPNESLLTGLLSPIVLGAILSIAPWILLVGVSVAIEALPFTSEPPGKETAADFVLPLMHLRMVWLVAGIQHIYYV